jgi:Zn-dependent protease with chaperone function
MKSVNANYFDGQSARQQSVTLTIAQGQLQLHGEELLRELPLSNLSISAKMGRSPRLVHFSDGGHCEINNHADFEAMLQGADMHTKSLLSILENSWRYALAATLLLIIFVIGSFYWGLPWIANVAAERIPPAIALGIDTHVLNSVDDGLMQASELSSKRKQTLTKRFDNLRNMNALPQHHLEFRNSKAIGANAFALPGGTIIVTDQLVALAGNDEEILAVLAHELGHVSERHPMRQLLQSSVIGLAMTWYLGDISTLLAAAPTILLQTSYSRNFERRADLYAANILRMNGIAPSRLADILLKLESSHSGKTEAKEHKSHIADLFSSHPDTAKRIQQLRNNTGH